MTSFLKGLLLTAIAYVAFLIFTIPAHFGIRYLPTEIKLSGVRGTLLNGKADYLAFQDFSLENIEWRLKPLALFLGQIKTHMSFEQSDLRGQGDVIVKTQRRIGFHDATVTGNTKALDHYLKPYGVTLTGDFDLELASFDATRQGPEHAQGQLILRNAELTSPAPLVLGDVEIDLTQPNESALATLTNNGEAISLNGQTEFKPGWEYQTQLKLTPTASTPANVKKTLSFLGQPDDTGAITINQSGMIPVAW